MRHLVTAALVCSAALGLTVGGLAPASAADPYPKSKGWQKIDERTTIPAGYACKDRIVVHETGHVRLIAANSTHIFQDWGEDSKGVFTNPVKGKSVTLDESGDLVGVLSAGGKTFRGNAYGASVYRGLGTTGILSADGVQRVTVTHIGAANENVRVTVVSGKKVDVCKQLGTSGVPGKNLPQP